MPASTAKKLLLSAAVVGSAAGLVSMGTYASWTDSATASATISSGTVDINLGSAGSADNRLTIGATGLVPGDTVQRRVKLTNAGEDLASVTLTTTATASSTLDTDTTNGLQMKIERCGGALGWRESASTPYTYTCDQAVAGDNAGSRSSVLAERAVIGSNLALSGMTSLTAAGVDDMVVTVRLPDSTGTSLQGKSSTVQYSFTGTQRAGTSK
jgi:predicted ribosomally synthesized peptide with SipW-like signal peptide